MGTRELSPEWYPEPFPIMYWNKETPSQTNANACTCGYAYLSCTFLPLPCLLNSTGFQRFTSTCWFASISVVSDPFPLAGASQFLLDIWAKGKEHSLRMKTQHCSLAEVVVERLAVTAVLSTLHIHNEVIMGQRKRTRAHIAW